MQPQNTVTVAGTTAATGNDLGKKKKNKREHAAPFLLVLRKSGERANVGAQLVKTWAFTSYKPQGDRGSAKGGLGHGEKSSFTTTFPQSIHPTNWGVIYKDIL